jgi:hypothetical protein
LRSARRAIPEHVRRKVELQGAALQPGERVGAGGAAADVVLQQHVGHEQPVHSDGCEGDGWDQDVAVCGGHDLRVGQRECARVSVLVDVRMCAGMAVAPRTRSQPRSSRIPFK